jgi:hypothetical protein
VRAWSAIVVPICRFTDGRADGLFAAMVSAVWSAQGIRSSAGRTRLTSPTSAASAASMSRAVSSRFIAWT